MRINVDVDIDDVLGYIEDDELLEELKNREIEFVSSKLPDTTNLKGLVELWFEKYLGVNMWAFTEEDIIRIIKAQLNIN